MLKAKQVKEAQIRELESRFGDVRDLVLLAPEGWQATDENNIRLDLRKKNIRLMLVKNTLARRVLDSKGIKISEAQWKGPTIVAWGGTSIAGLSKELEKTFKTHKKVKVKTAVADGQEVTFEQALKMPTREEAIGRVVTLILSAGGGLLGRILGPGGALASQIKDGIKEAKGGEQPAAAEGGEPAPEGAG